MLSMTDIWKKKKKKKTSFAEPTESTYINLTFPSKTKKSSHPVNQQTCYIDPYRATWSPLRSCRKYHLPNRHPPNSISPMGNSDQPPPRLETSAKTLSSSLPNQYGTLQPVTRGYLRKHKNGAGAAAFKCKFISRVVARRLRPRISKGPGARAESLYLERRSLLRYDTFLKATLGCFCGCLGAAAASLLFRVLLRKQREFDEFAFYVELFWLYDVVVGVSGRAVWVALVDSM